MLSSRTAAVVLFSLIAMLVGAGCGGSAEREAEPRACGTDSECGAGERCVLEAPPVSYPRIAIPCPYAPCGAAGECAEGLVCTFPPSSPSPGGFCASMVCAPRCTPTSCSQGQVCRDTGICGYPQCDEPGVAACPEYWRCDPTAARTESQVDYGSVIEDTLETRDSIVRGCVRKRCDEADGQACKEFWRCAPQETSGGSGCVPIPCQESGHCENDDYICEPTSSLSRAPSQDFYGCFFKNCEEGLECIAPSISDPSVAYCDHSAPNADPSGCALRTCDEGNRCVETYVCDPSNPQADSIGCVPGPGSGGSAGSLGNGGTNSGGSGSSGGGGGTTSTGGSTSSGGDTSTGEGHCVET